MTGRRRRFAAVGATVGALAVAYLATSLALAISMTRAKRAPAETTPAAFGRAYSSVAFPSRRPEVRLSGWLLPGADGEPVIILVHGLDANRTSDGMLDLAARLVARGFGALLFDLAGHGESADGRTSGGFFEQLDVAGARDFILGRAGARARVGLLGFSMGAVAALLAARGDTAVGAVVADSPFASLRDQIPPEAERQTHLPAWAFAPLVPAMEIAARLLYGIDVAAVRPEDAAAEVAAPILLIHGTADDWIPAEDSRRILTSAREGRLWLVPGSGHAEAFEDHPDAYADTVAAFFRAHLARADAAEGQKMPVPSSD